MSKLETNVITDERLGGQLKTIDGLQHIINPENGEAFLRVYENIVMSSPRHILFDTTDIVEKQRFELLKGHYEMEGYHRFPSEFSAVIDVPRKVAGLSRNDFFNFLIDACKIHDVFEGNFVTALRNKAAGRKIMLLFDNIQNLDRTQGEILLNLFDRVQFLSQASQQHATEAQLQVIASVPGLNIAPKLRHSFLTVPQADDSERFDPIRARELMTIHHKALEELKHEDAVTIDELPHKTGKSIFRKALVHLMPGSIIEVNAAINLSAQNKLKIHEIPRNTGHGIGFIDHAHLVNNWNQVRNPLIAKLGKSIFVSTKE